MKELISRYVKLRVEEVRLESLERVVTLMGFVAFASLAFIFVFTMFCFGLLGLGTYLGRLFDNPTAGYLTIAGIMLVFIIILIAIKKKLINMVAGAMLAILTKPKRDKEYDKIKK